MRSCRRNPVLFFSSFGSYRHFVALLRQNIVLSSQSLYLYRITWTQKIGWHASTPRLGFKPTIPLIGRLPVGTVQRPGKKCLFTIIILLQTRRSGKEYYTIPTALEITTLLHHLAASLYLKTWGLKIFWRTIRFLSVMKHHLPVSQFLPPSLSV